MPRSFAPPQPKHLFVGFGANVIVSVKFSQPLRFFFLYPIASLLHLFKPAQRGFAPRAARRAAASASRLVRDPPASRRRARFAFHPNRRNRDAVCWAADSAHRNTGRARIGLRAPSHESGVRWRQNLAAVPAIGTFHRRDASNASLRACACEELRPEPPGARHRLSAFWRDAW